MLSLFISLYKVLHVISQIVHVINTSNIQLTWVARFREISQHSYCTEFQNLWGHDYCAKDERIRELYNPSELSMTWKLLTPSFVLFQRTCHLLFSFAFHLINICQLLMQNEDGSLWKLGTLPLGLVTFWNKTFPLDRSWHVLGLGYNPHVSSGDLERAAVIHYNGNMKPWLEIGLPKFRSYWSEYLDYDQPFLRECNINP